jgi:hypothetical protein
MKRFVAYFCLILFLQIVVLVLAMILAGKLGGEIAVVMLLYIYFPTVLLIQYTGNFVGCANMIEPFLIGVPLGIAVYSLVASLIICGTRRLKQA